MNDSLQSALDWISGTPLRVAIILLTAMISQIFGTRAIERAMNRLATADLVPGPRNIVARQKERARTIGGVLSSTLKTVIWVVAVGMALGEFGFNLGPLIASAGILGVALGLGAMSNTEPVVRLNLETRGDSVLLTKHEKALLSLLN